MHMKLGAAMYGQADSTAGGSVSSASLMACFEIEASAISRGFIEAQMGVCRRFAVILYYRGHRHRRLASMPRRLYRAIGIASFAFVAGVSR